tara:strand:+ start:63 stop:503 length:441 start_codon:yes stop_codon:yes gene_type:complete
MIKYKIKISSNKNFPLHEPIKQIKQIPKNLQSAIDTFQDELNWSGMWSLEDSKKRLQDGWKFNILEMESLGWNKIYGWIWLSPQKEACNLYVHKYHRNNGWGEKLILSILSVAKEEGYDWVWSEIDEWNKISQRLVDKIGYEEIKN